MKIKFLFLYIIPFFFSTNLCLSQNINSKSSYDSISEKVSFYSKQQDNKKALFFSKKLFLKAIKNDDLSQKAKSCYRIAQFQGRLNFKDSAFYYYNKSKELYLKINDSVEIGRSLLNIAIIESDFGSYSSSDSTLVESIKFIQGKRDRTISSAYNCLGINSKKRFLYEDAISYYQKALDISKIESSKIIYRNNIANVYKELGNYSKSILILENLLKDSISSLHTKAKVIDNLAYAKWLQNSKKNTLKDFLLALKIRKNIKDNNGLIASYSHLSEYFKKKNKSKSLFYANKMYEISKKEKSPQDQIESIEKIVELQTPQKAIKYYKESIRLSDSIQVEEIMRQNKFAKIKYNFEEEELLKLKFKSQAIENKLVAEQEHNQKNNIEIFGIILTLGLLFFIYRRKQQHKKRILQESYNTETRIAKKLHDELANDIFNALAKVQNPTIEKEEIINDLDKIYLQTRAISHENDSVVTGSDFEKYFRNLVASYNSDACKIILKGLSSLDLSNLKKEKQIVIYRVFNELFVNMKKHSKATLVVLSCKKINSDLEIIYTDNGVGFKNNTVILKNGLKNMETRIKMIQGTINFENKSNRGLRVSIFFKN